MRLAPATVYIEACARKSRRTAVVLVPGSPSIAIAAAALLSGLRNSFAFARSIFAITSLPVNRRTNSIPIPDDQRRPF